MHTLVIFFLSVFILFTIGFNILDAYEKSQKHTYQIGIYKFQSIALSDINLTVQSFSKAKPFLFLKINTSQNIENATLLYQVHVFNESSHSFPYTYELNSYDISLQKGENMISIPFSYKNKTQVSFYLMYGSSQKYLGKYEIDNTAQKFNLLLSINCIMKNQTNNTILDNSSHCASTVVIYDSTAGTTNVYNVEPGISTNLKLTDLPYSNYQISTIPKNSSYMVNVLDISNSSISGDINQTINCYYMVH